MFCHDPTSWYAYFLAVFQGGSGYAIIVAMQGYAVKRVPKMIRGIIMSLIAIFGCFGTIFYLQLQKVFFKAHPNMVFGTLAFFDLIAFILIVVSIAFGWYGDPAAKQGDEDGASNAPEDNTALNEDVGFTDEFPEVPFARDLYEEAVPEVSEYREETIAHHLSYAEDSMIQGTVRGKSLRYRDSMRKSKKYIEERSRVIDSMATSIEDDPYGSDMLITIDKDQPKKTKSKPGTSNRKTYANYNKASQILPEDTETSKKAR